MDGRQEIVYCEEAAVDIENAMVYPRNFGEPYKVAPPEPAGDSTQLAIDGFFRCIREKRKPLASVQAGFDGAMAAILGRQSIEDGRVVTMEELLKEG
jgi:predicted dehydrogenase